MDKEQFIIDEKMITNATSYIPLATKVTLAKEVAKSCVRFAEVDDKKILSNETLTLPQLYEDDTMSKKIYLMCVLLTEYFKVEVNDDFTAEDYDHYAKFHPINQLERFKSGSVEIKNKVFDILYDFKELKKLIDTEIYNLKFAHNDTLERFLASITLMSDPETIKKMLTELKMVTEQVQEKQVELKQKRKLAKAEEPKVKESKKI